MSQQESQFVSYSYQKGNIENVLSDGEWLCHISETNPPTAAARPLATATPPVSVTNDAARSRASNGAHTLPKNDTVAPLSGVDAPEEPANPAGIDERQPPPDPPAKDRTRSVHFDDTTDEEDAPAADGDPNDPDDDDDDDDNDDDDNDDDDDGNDDTDWTAIYVMEQQADMPDYVVTEADRRLDKVYGDHPHSNARKHLTGGLAKDKLWQDR